MESIRLVALKGLRYGPRSYAKGETFLCEPRHVRILTAGKLAAPAPEKTERKFRPIIRIPFSDPAPLTICEDPAPPAPFEPSEVAKRTYKRRDMKAE